MLDQLGPCKRRISFIGFDTSVGGEPQQSQISSYIEEHYPAFKPVSVGNVFRGPYNNRTLSQVAYAEFSDNEAARAFAGAVKTKPSISKSGGATINVRPALSKLYLARNYALKGATELIKADGASSGQTVETKDRTIVVGGLETFLQGKNEPGGKIVGLFAHLSRQ